MAAATVANVVPPRRQHPYEREVAEAMQLFRTLDAETGWKELPEQQGVRITMKDVPGTPTGVIKGVGFVAGYPPREVLATIQSFEARSECTRFFPCLCSCVCRITHLHLLHATAGDGLMETGRCDRLPAVGVLLSSRDRAACAGRLKSWIPPSILCSTTRSQRSGHQQAGAMLC